MGKRIRIGRAQLGKLPPVHHAPRQFNALRRQILQRIGIRAPRARGRLAPARQAHLAKQDIAQLLGRADVEAFAGELMNLRLDLALAIGKLVGKLGQHGAVHQNALMLHRFEHRNERPLQRFINRDLAFLEQARLQQFPQAQASHPHLPPHRPWPGQAAPAQTRSADLPEPATSLKLIGLWPRCFTDISSMPWPFSPDSMA